MHTLRHPENPTANPLDNPLDRALCEALATFRYGLRRFFRFAEESARAAGITPQQYNLLLSVYGQPEKDWASIRELAEALQVRHHTAVGLVQRCETAGLIERSPDLEDRRQVRVHLTPKGVGILLPLARRNHEALLQLRRSSLLDDAPVPQQIAASSGKKNKVPATLPPLFLLGGLAAERLSALCLDFAPLAA